MESSPQPHASFSATFEAQSASLRRLARSLVHDASSADDVVQETWAAYLKRPPVEAGAIGGFLATLTRRLAWKARRGEERREAREKLAARPERSGDDDDFAQRASAMREVLDALAHLREPYRRALWQRYFDDLPPREIALASGESLATVKSRLQRGLELLREELDRRHGGRRSNWAVALMPLSVAGTGALGIGISGGLLMGSAIKITAATLVIAGLAGWCLWSSRDGASTAPAEVAALANAAASKPENSADHPGTQDPSTRSAVVDPASATESALVVDPELAHPYLYMLVVRTIDEYGLPVPHGRLMLGPARSSLNAAQILHEQAGSKTVIWRGKEPEMDVDIQLGSSTTLQGSRRVHVRAGTPCEVALLGDSNVQARVALIFSVDTFVRAAGERMGVQALDNAEADLSMSRFPHPHARFGDRFVMQHAEPAPTNALNLDQDQLDVLSENINSGWQFSLSRGLRVEADEVVGKIADSASVPDTSHVEVHVLDEHGEPAVNALVALGHEIDGADRTTFTDEHGDAAFDGVESGWWEARAGGGPGGLARQRLLVEAPNQLQWNTSLDRGARVIGRVLDSEGKPAQNAIVRYESLPNVVARSTSVSMSLETQAGEEISERGESSAIVPGELRLPWVDQTSPREDGTFEIANLPLGLGRLLVLDKDHLEEGALLVEDGVLAGDHEYVLRIPADPGTLRLRVKPPLEFKDGKLEVRAISESTGRGSSFHSEEDGALASSALAPGWYRVELGAGCLGWHDLGRQYVGPASHVDLGTFTPPPPASVHVILPASVEGDHPPLGLTFYLRRSDLDIRGEPRGLGGSKTLLLPAGEYWVFWTANDATIHHKPMKLEAGGTAELDLR